MVIDGPDEVLVSAISAFEIGTNHSHWGLELALDPMARPFAADFKVMVRPLKAINLLHERMRQMLEKLG